MQHSFAIKLYALLKEQNKSESITIYLPINELVSVSAIVSSASRALTQTVSMATGVRLAVNERFVTGEVVLAEGDRLALIPPVSGG